MKVYNIVGLPEETIAYLFARYSRSTKSIMETLDEGIKSGAIPKPNDLQPLTPAATKLHEIYTIGYGHSSVAEHAVLHLAIENITILAAKALEETRLASFTEKSTRYVEWTHGNIMDIPICHELLDVYQELLPIVQEKHGKKAFDILRGLLPIGSYTSLGMTINARILREMLNELSSHPLDEIQRLSVAIREEALKVVPTLLRYLDEPSDVARIGLSPVAKEDMGVKLLWRHQPDLMVDETWDDVAMEVVIDYGGFRDLQRHRKVTLNQGPVRARGFYVPREIDEMDLGEAYRKVVNKAHSAANTMAERNVYGAQYLLPLCTYHKFLWKMDLAEAKYIINLRSQPQSHETVQYIAKQMQKLLGC